MRKKLKPNSYLLDLQFNDFEDFTNTVRDWNVEFRQLDRGQFHGKLFQVGSGTVHFGHASLTRHLDQHGVCPAGLRTIVVPATSDQNFRWRDQHITGNKIAIFPKSGELDAISTTGFEVFTLSIPEEALLAIDRIMCRSCLENGLKNVEVLKITDNGMNMLRHYLAQLQQELSRNPALLHTPGFSMELESELPQRLLTALAFGQDATIVPPSRLRDQALKKALDYIAEYSGETLKVLDLCKVTGVSVRTLRYAFLDRFGISPKAYLVTYRLNKVRKELLASSSSTTKISDIANLWGFWHMGQFAADYRKLFGELPSETRIRRRV